MSSSDHQELQPELSTREEFVQNYTMMLGAINSMRSTAKRQLSNVTRLKKRLTKRLDSMQEAVGSSDDPLANPTKRLIKKRVKESIGILEEMKQLCLVCDVTQDLKDLNEISVNLHRQLVRDSNHE